MDNPIPNMNAKVDAGLGALLDFGFTRFITLSVIKIVYIVGLVLIVLSWIFLVIGALISGKILAAIGVLVVGAVGAVIYAIFFRIYLELIVVIFRIGENTSKLVELRGGTPATNQGL